MSGAFANPGAPERPTTPDSSYGVPAAGGSMVEWAWVVDELAAAADYWLATVAPDGRPHVAPIWGVLVDNELYLETAPTTLKARNLARDQRAAVHIGGGIAVVIVNGEVLPFVPEPVLAQRLAAAFGAKYQGYEPGPTDWGGGGLYLVRPRTVLAWREMDTATRWHPAAG